MGCSWLSFSPETFMKHSFSAGTCVLTRCYMLLSCILATECWINLENLAKATSTYLLLRILVRFVNWETGIGSLVFHLECTVVLTIIMTMLCWVPSGRSNAFYTLCRAPDGNNNVIHHKNSKDGLIESGLGKQDLQKSWKLRCPQSWKTSSSKSEGIRWAFEN